MGVVIELPVTNLRQSNQSKSKLIVPPRVQRENLHIVYITYEYLFSQLNCKYLQSLKQIEKLPTKKQQVEQADRGNRGAKGAPGFGVPWEFTYAEQMKRVTS